MIEPSRPVEQYWNTEHPVLEILRHRRATGSKPGQRSDFAKVGLAIGGGGMRGAISAAMCTQLDDANFKDAFDVVYGTSSGAINAAFFASQPARTCWIPLSIYYDDFVMKRFIGYARALRGKPIVDLDFIFDDVLKSRIPLDYEAAAHAAQPVILAVTDAEANRAIVVRDHHTGHHLETYLRSGARLPLATNNPSVGDNQLIDGALLMPLPFRMAVDDGCTHILSLSTHRMRAPSRRVAVTHRAYSAYLDRISRGLGTAYLNALQQRQTDREWLSTRRFDSAPGEPHVLDLAPLPWMSEIRFTDTDPRTVLDGIRAAYAVSSWATEGIDRDHSQDSLGDAIPRMAMAVVPESAA
ncbi:patatin-like phospholipase family protein [Nocardia sp. NPDC006044]|uniref:patatin-like phospholipase family protein n=1 Tax=Nocardia sp. NPDC006044 TaxID=3364306 RepID=UPI00367D877E